MQKSVDTIVQEEKLKQNFPELWNALQNMNSINTAMLGRETNEKGSKQNDTNT